MSGSSLHLEAVYKPSKWQVKFHSACMRDGSMIDEILGAGAAGPGKSLALTMNPFDKICEEHARATDPEHPFPIRMGDSEGWALHLRRTGKTLDQTLARAHKIFPKVDPGVKWESSKSTFHFSCGYRYQFGHCNEKNDWEQYDSNQYDEILFDELVQFYREQYDNIRSRLRSSDPVLSRKLRVRAMSNPNRKAEDGATVLTDSDWVRRRFVDPAREGNTILKRQIVNSFGEPEIKTRLYLPARLTDNPDPLFVKQYDRQLSDLPEHLRRAMRDGDWYVTAGAYWSDVWHPRYHVVRPFKIPRGWKWFRSMDWGYKHFGCVGWYAMDSEGCIFKVREFTFKGMKAGAVAGRIKEIELDLGIWDERHDCSRIIGPADTQLWEERGDEIAVTKAEVMAECGVAWVRADKRMRARNARILHEKLGDHDNFTTTPGIVFFENCHNTIMRIPTVPADPNDIEQPLDTGDDHWIDETMYAVAYASTEVRVPMVRKVDSDDYKRRPGIGRYGYGQVL